MPAYKDEERKTWYAKFYFKDWDGKTKSKMKRGFRTKKEALDYERDFLTSHTGYSPDLMMGSLIDKYLDDLQHHVRQSTYLLRQRTIALHIRPFFENLKVSDVTAAHVREWQNGLIKSGYKPSTLLEWHTMLSSIFNYGVKFCGVKNNPARTAGSIGNKKSSKEIKFWTKEEFDRFIEVVDQPEYRFLFLTLYYSGMREGECLALKQNDIVHGQHIIVDETFGRVGKDFVFGPPKTAASKRKIAMPTFWWDEYDSFVRAHFEMPERIFRFKDVGHLNGKLRQYAEIAGCPPITLHDLRHSHASLLIELGQNVLLIAERLGHDSVSTTLETYSHLFPNKQAELASLLDRLNE